MVVVAAALSALTALAAPTAASADGDLFVYTGNGAQNLGYSKFAAGAGRPLVVSPTLPLTQGEWDSHQCVLLPRNTVRFTAGEQNAFRAFMERGGTLVAIAEHSGAPNQTGVLSVTTMNDLAYGTGIQGFSTSEDNGARVQTNTVSGIPRSQYTKDVYRVGYGGVTTLSVALPAFSLVQTQAIQPADVVRPFVAVTPVGNGKLVYAGDSNVFSNEDPITYTNTDNDKLARNVCGDITPPEITITTPANGGRYQRGQVLPAAWTCTDFDSGVDTRTFVNGALSGTESGLPFETTGPAGGSVTKTFTVDCTDKAGNVAPTKSSQYVVDDRPPTVTINEPDGNVYARGAEIPASWSCTDPDNDVATRAYTNGALSGSQSGDELDTGTKGPKSFTVTCTDTVGNTASKTTTYTVSNSPPVATITAPLDGARFARGASVNAAWGCTDADNDLVSRDFTNGTFAGTQSGLPIDTSTPGGSTVAKTFTVTCFDEENATNSPKSVTYYVDPSPPSVTINVPVDGGTYERRSAALASWSCFDEDPDDIDPNPQKTFGTKPVGAAIDTAGTGEKSFSVTCTDRVGNSASKTVRYTVVDSSPPVVTITVPKDGATYDQGQVVSPSYSCVDPDGVADIKSCVRANGATGPVDTSKGGTFNFTVNGEDQAGNKASKTVKYNVKAKATTPGAAVSPSTTPGATKVCKSRRQFRIRVKKLKGGVKAVSATVFVNGKKTLTRKGKRVTATVTLKGLKKGQYKVKINVKYSNGRVLSYTRKFKTCTPKGK